MRRGLTKKVISPSTKRSSVLRFGARYRDRFKCKMGRPPIPTELQALICKMASENSGWGEGRIANELRVNLGIWVEGNGRIQNEVMVASLRFSPSAVNVLGAARSRSLLFITSLL